MLFGTPTLDECKLCAVLHKTDPQEKYFLRFLIRFELLGYYVMQRIFKGCPYLKKEDIRDVKHTVIVGILRAFTTVRLDERPEYIPLRVITYVRHEMNKVYRYLKREQNMLIDEEFYTVDQRRFTAAVPKLDALLFTTDNTLTPEELDLLHRRFIDGDSYPEISAALGNIGCNRVRRRLRKLQNRVAACLLEEGIVRKIRGRKSAVRKVTGPLDTISSSVGTAIQTSNIEAGAKGEASVQA